MESDIIEICQADMLQQSTVRRLTFTPIQKQITTEKRKTFTPFLSVSANTFGSVGIGGGLYYNNLGFESKYLTDFQAKGFELGLHIKF